MYAFICLSITFIVVFICAIIFKENEKREGYAVKLLLLNRKLNKLEYNLNKLEKRVSNIEEDYNNKEDCK